VGKLQSSAALETRDLLFNSLQYLVFLPIVFLSFWLVPHRFRIALLLIASYVFYMSWRPVYGLLILGLTLGNFLLVPLITRYPQYKKWWLALVVAGNLITLGIFKYAYFCVHSVHQALGFAGIDWKDPVLHITLPLGISFFVFEFIHYAVEVYRGKPLITSLPKFALFASFFPTQIAGPIKRYLDFIPQLDIPSKFKWEYLDRGMQMILMGLMKKVIIADNLAMVAQAGFGHPERFSSLDLWLVTYAFAFQIFFDFAGYTDIARGSAMLFGYKVPINFNLPYIAANVSDFWHRWHISLSTWLRDYLFIPLGGSRGSKWFVYRNLFITMTLGGLWHGAAAHFLIWGAYQGILLVLHREYKEMLGHFNWAKGFVESKFYHVVSVVVTFHLMCIGWVFFRAEHLGTAVTMLKSMVLQLPANIAHFSTALLTVLQIRDPIIFPALLIILPVFMLSQVVVNWLNGKRFYESPPWAVQVGTMVAAMTVLTIFSPDTSPRFIYFQF
jgi:alginate O-acetyltransferase complex protein AlgI